MMSKKASWVKKRRLQTARAKAQQRHRRKRGLFKKAVEFCHECESDVFVAVRVRKTGQMYILDSSSRNQWLSTLSDLTFYYPPPVKEAIEDIIPQSERLSDPGGASASAGDEKA